ncbi:MAG TPA: NADP-dependent oxidoreductase [Streptosporangiaceae bacterium]|nr:NADP-dependent oxidoreductase [Streptosporangiaceae bacterium]
MDTMMALRAHQRGGPEQLVYEQAPVPVSGPGDVLIAVHAAAITFAELTWDQSWTTSDGADRTPVIPSHEVSGTVAALGDAVTDFAVGDEVFGLIDFDRDGAAAEYVTVPDVNLARKPPSISHPEAACLSLAALTAWQALVDRADLALGEQALVLGGAGGVGLFAVQLAAILGGQVTATDTGRNSDFVAGLGARQVIVVGNDSSGPQPSGMNVVIDTVGGDAQAGAYATLRPGGRLVTLVSPPSQELADRYGVHAMFFIVEPDAAELEHLGDLVADGRLQAVISQEIPLSAGREAYMGGGRPHPPGKTVLVVR